MESFCNSPLEGGGPLGNGLPPISPHGDRPLDSIPIPIRGGGPLGGGPLGGGPRGGP